MYFDDVYVDAFYRVFRFAVIWCNCLQAEENRVATEAAFNQCTEVARKEVSGHDGCARAGSF